MKYLYIGLGNPGEEYQKTRHNAGQILLEKIAQRHNEVEERIIDQKKSVQKSFVVDGVENIFLFPKCFMNSSGGFVKKFRDPEHMIVVVYDDIDLPFGELRLSYNKSGGSHNGVLSIIKQLGTQKFITLRIGISKIDSFGKVVRVSGAGRVQEFVMANFTSDEIKKLDEVAVRAEHIMKLLQTNGLQKTQSIYKTNFNNL